MKKLWDEKILEIDNEKVVVNKLIGGQVNFFKAYKNILGREYPKEQLHFVENSISNLSIIYLNTYWMCYDSATEEDKIHIGLNSLYKCLENINSTDFNIVIGHHRLDDLNPQVKNSLKSIFRNKGIDIYIGGHRHQVIIEHDVNADMEFCFCKQELSQKIIQQVLF